MSRRLLHIAMLSLAVTLAAGQARGSGIANTAHDFSAETWSGGEICKPCHTPHHAIAQDLSGRLWNHTLSTATYTLHGSSATGQGTRLDATKSGGQSDMDMASRLCLSCHDGTVALDSFGGMTGSTMINGGVAEAGGNLGTNLSNDHPVGINAAYNPSSGGAGHYRYKPLTSVSGGTISVGSESIRLVKVATGVTPYQNGDQVDGSGNPVMITDTWAISCVSCHDVHNGAGNEAGLLRVNNAGSALCLGCHNK